MSNSPISNHSFPKSEKLCSTKSIEQLFSAGQSFIAYPLRVVCTQSVAVQGEAFAQIMVSVSKKKFKRAVRRNRVKRLIREAYRLNKSSLLSDLESKNIALNIAFLYLKDELPEFLDVEKAVVKAIDILKSKINQGGV